MSTKIYFYFLEFLRRVLKLFKVKTFPVIYKKHKIFIRTFNSVDVEVVRYVFSDRYHRPLIDLSSRSPVILDLGSNIGCSVLDLKCVYPDSLIIGCEMDRDNYLLALKNCSKLSNAKILNNAVWHEDSYIKYYKGVDTFSNPDAYSIIKGQEVSTSEGVELIDVKTLSLNLLAKEFSLETIDYVKMDIEGAELEVISLNNEWLNKVTQMKIEYHNGESDAEALSRVLIDKGFTVKRDTHHPTTLNAYKN